MSDAAWVCHGDHPDVELPISVRQGERCPECQSATSITRYTLDEAKRELARRECLFNGHSFDVIEQMGVGPVSVVCSRCGESWQVKTHV